MMYRRGHKTSPTATAEPPPARRKPPPVPSVAGGMNEATMIHTRPPLYVVDHYHRELADRATRRLMRRIGLALVLALLVGAAVGALA